MKESKFIPATRELQRGVTLLELVTTVSLVAILAAIAVPNMSDFIRNGRLAAAINDMQSSLQLARTEAIKRGPGHNVAICASTTPELLTATCSGGVFNGWIVFEDTDGNGQRNDAEPYLERHATFDSSLTVHSNGDGIVSYSQTGFLTDPSMSGKTWTQHISICDSRGNTAVGSDSTARAVIISDTGRPHASKTFADVNLAGGC
jgi:type IV fimbrial biogenesis protein FimT